MDTLLVTTQKPPGLFPDPLHAVLAGSSSRLSAADGGWSGPCGRSIGGFGGAFAREKLILDGYHLVLFLRNRRIARREVIPCSVACAQRRVTGE